MTPRPFDRLRDSQRLLRRHPVLSLGLGMTVLLSIGAVCCAGVGLVSAPWFACELFAFQLGFLKDRRVPRRWSWVGAGLLQSVAVVLVAVAASLAITWLGPDVSLHPPMGQQPTGADRGWTLLLAGAGVVVALTFLVPFLYAPLILLDKGGPVGGALLDSARLVHRGGMAAHVLFSFASHVLQVLPALVAAAATLVFADRTVLPLALALSIVPMAATVPLGQGMIAAAYFHRRREVPDRRTAPEVGPSPWLALGMGAVLIAPALATLLVAGSLVRPSQPRAGRASGGRVIAQAELEGREQRNLYLPGTSLEVHAGPRSLSVVAGDGGGAGRIPRPGGARFDRVRVLQDRDAYAIELQDGSHHWVTWIDRAGVRLDDGLADRLGDHLSPWELSWIALSLLVTPIVLGRQLAALGELRKRTTTGEQDEAPQGPLDMQTVLRRARWASLALLPVVVTALVFGVRALQG